MTGFIKGLFSKKNGGAAPQAPAPAPKSGDAFFLAPDDAKTFGDIDYMREVKTVERTFPKGKRKPQVRQISAQSYRNLDNQTFSSGPSFAAAPKTSFAAAKPSFSAPSTPAASTPAPKAQETETRRPTNDTSMDMFRNMAKNIRKG